MKKIPLTQGKFAIVDDVDFETLARFKWCATKYSNTFRAMRKVVVNGKKVSVYMHRVILGLSNPKISCDHINGNGLDNRRENLRDCLNSENTRNCQLSKNNESGYKGVSWYARHGKWQAHIKINRKSIGLGYFSNLIDAARAYNDAAKKYHGEFARLNILPD